MIADAAAAQDLVWVGQVFLVILVVAGAIQLWRVLTKTPKKKPPPKGGQE